MVCSYRLYWPIRFISCDSFSIWGSSRDGISLAHRSLGQFTCNTVEARDWHLPPSSEGYPLGERPVLTATFHDPLQPSCPTFLPAPNKPSPWPPGVLGPLTVWPSPKIWGCSSWEVSLVFSLLGHLGIQASKAHSVSSLHINQEKGKAS